MASSISRTSVVVATYNGSAFIMRQLQSLAEQTLRPLEIIVSDDGSNAGTLALVEAFAKQSDFRFKVRRNAHNMGFSENFLQAALLATGDFVAFCDQDDIWHPAKLAWCQQSLEHSGAVLAVHAAHLIDREGAPLGPFAQGISKTSVCPPLSYGPWACFFGFSMVFDRRLLEIIPPSARGIDYITGKPGLAHDRWILFLANLVGSTSEIAEPLVEYRQHGDNTFGAGKKQGSQRKSRAEVASEADLYLRSAIEQRELINKLALAARIGETQFDHARSARFWDSAGKQQRARNLLYSAKAAIPELRQWSNNLRDRVYRELPGRKLRLRAALKDLAFIIDGVAGSR